MNKVAITKIYIAGKLLLLTLITMIIALPYISVRAAQTNINEVTDLFDKHIENKEALFDNLKAQNSNAIDKIKSREGVNSIRDIEKAEAKAAELNSIKESELDNAGRSKRSSKDYQFYDENELEPDYTKPGNKLHRLDSDDIAVATDKKMQEIGIRFLDKLKSEGFDCKTVKGSIIKEPTYYIDIKKEKQKNTEYDQLFCEEPRNKYNCNDSLNLRCTKIGTRFRNEEARTLRIGGHWLYWNKPNWGFALHWKRKRNGWHVSSHHPKGFFGTPSESPWWNNPAAIIADARAHIAAHLGVALEQIGEHVQFPASGRGIGSINPVGSRWRVAWQEYEFGYTYREAYKVCEQWQDDWSERCMLK